MFTPLTRTLKLGLTAITILTAGAGAAFAQPTGFDTALDPIDDCSGGGAQNPSYCTAPVVNCINNPFDTDCATTLGTKAHTVAKVRYCGEASHRAESACATTISGVNAAHWVNPENWEDNPSRVPTNVPNPIASVLNPITYGRHQFLKGTASGLNTGDDIEREKGTLFFNTTTFNGRALDGDATDGVAFFIGWDDTSEIRRTRAYAGILSGTDLGAPVMQTSGTASWVGQLQAVWFEINRDFVLEVTFGGAGNTAGSIEALVHRQSSDRIYDLASHFHLKGTFDDSGMITGTVAFGNFTGNDREDTTGIRYRGVLTGLIGQEGAVGAFHSGEDAAGADHGLGTLVVYSGGFVARPAEVVTGAEAYLERTCSDDPFHYLCFTSNERAVKILTECGAAGTSSSSTHCTGTVNSCVNDPFGTDCHRTLGGYALNIAQTKRIELCDNTDNENDPLCMDTNLTNLCGYAPFSPLCLGNSAYSSERARLFESCQDDPNNLICNGVSQGVSDKKPNTATWVDSFVTSENPNELPSAAETGKRSQFLKGGKSDLDKTGISVQEHGALHFETAPLDDNNPLAGLIAGNPNPNSGADVGKEGVAFFWGYKGQYAFYSGILEDTDLGAPVNSVSRTTATWKGKFQSLWFTTKTDFDLEVAFGGNQVGTINARIANNGRKTSFSHFFIDGTFDNNGLITGSILAGKFTGGERANVRGTTYPGILRGLIGEEGAVGSFIAGTSPDNGNILTGNNYYSGGFIATPPSVVDHADWVAVFEPATTPATPAITQFLAGDAALIVNANPNRVVTFATATYNNIPLDRAATNNGFATNNDGSSNYAGLLSGVNLGAPLTAQTAVGVWQGYLSSHTQTISNTANFILTVNFGTGSKAGTISATPSQHVITGNFDDRGVIDGTVTRTHGNDVRAATLTGLIGSGGAIGVFHNNAGQQSLVGGFVARKAP